MQLKDLLGAKLPLIPVNPITKRPLTDTWSEDISTRFIPRACPPGQAIALVYGKQAGVILIDLDIKNPEQNGINKWNELFGDINTASITTQSGGKHLIFLNDDRLTGNRRGGLKHTGIDVRAGGRGFGLLPPSPSYAWDCPLDTEILPPPEKLIEIINQDTQEEYEPAEIPSDLNARTRYAQKAFEGEIDNVKSAPKGSRNETLNNAAFALGQLIAIDLLDQGTVERTLKDIGLSIGLSEHEVTQTIKSGIAGGRSKPRIITEQPKPKPTNPTVGGQSSSDKLPSTNVTPSITPSITTGLPPVYPTEITPLIKMQEPEQKQEYPNGSEPLTQQLLSHWIENRMDGNFIWLDHRRQWLIWNPAKNIWEIKPPGSHGDCSPVMQIAQDTAHWILHNMPDNGYDPAKWGTWAKTCNSHTYQSQAAAMVAARLADCPSININPIISTPTRTYNTGTNEWQPPDRNDFATVSLPKDIDETVEWRGTEWHKFIQEITRQDESLQNWLQSWAGYCLLPYIAEPSVAIFFGSGANGKSVFVQCLMAALGSYAITISSDAVVKSDSGRIKEDYAAIESKRLAVIPETQRGVRLDCSKIKELTGGDDMRVELKHGHQYVIRPKARLIIHTNHLLRIPDTDDGIWRRIVQVPFLYQVPPAERDPLLADKLIANLPVILAWIWEGTTNLLSQPTFKLPDCQTIKQSTSAYRKAENNVLGFIDAKCLKTVGAKTKAKELFDAFKSWLDDEGLFNNRYPPRRKDFIEGLENAGHKITKSTHGNELWIEDIQFIPDGYETELDYEPNKLQNSDYDSDYKTERKVDEY